jgi:carboxylate-amine ligase
MTDLTFVPSRPLTIGTELEWQLLDPATGKLSNSSIELLDHVHQKDDALAEQIIPEGVQNTIEVNSTVHESVTLLLEELYALRDRLQISLSALNLALAGSGTHPFEAWTKREVFPKTRYLKLHKQYGFLFKRFAVFGQHIHIGCSTAQDMLYLIHALARYIPHFIALSAASPFYAGVDTFFESSRLTMVDSFPTSGAMPFIQDWSKFQEYYEQLRSFKLIESLKELYWDIRPHPNFGTVEIRVFDSPLSLRKAATLVAYTQALSAYLLDTRPSLHPSLYLPYNYNRFSALRYGFNAMLVDFNSDTPKPLLEDLLLTFAQIKPYAQKLGSLNLLEALEIECRQGINDAQKLRDFYKKEGNFGAMMKYAIKAWQQS